MPVLRSGALATPHGLPASWVRAAGVMAFVSLLLEHGFPVDTGIHVWLHRLNLGLALWFAADLVVPLFQKRERGRALTLRRFEYLLLGCAALLYAVSWSPFPGLLQTLHLESGGALRSILIELFLLLAISIQLMRKAQDLFVTDIRPELILAGSFAGLIGIGTILLLLPNASARPEAAIGGLDAFFTATSAVCVTGLTVRDTGADFSNFGQMVILALFQIGGLGIITFVGFLWVFSSRALPVPQMVVFRQLIKAPALSDLKRQFAGIILATGAIEFLGAVLMFCLLPTTMDTLARMKWSLFHAISAFSSAGFALQSNSLEPFRASAGLLTVFMVLIILGGIGFLVIPELLAYRLTWGRIFRRFGRFKHPPSGRAPTRLSVHTRLSLLVTGVLIAAGVLIFWLLESDYVLRGRTWGESFLIAAFTAVTPRTVGFHTVPMGDLQNATLIVIVVLMVIGASPVSTGGGIKTVSFAIVLLALRSLICGRNRVEVFGRSIPERTLFAALGVLVLYLMTALVCLFFVALCDPQLLLRDAAFEVVSALSTVGLSTGITAQLSPESKAVLCVAMFIGRVGPISVVLAVFHGRTQASYELPEEEVVVG